MSFSAAASVWTQFLVAFGGLIEVGRLKRSDIEIATVTSCSVGIAAIQMALVVGATPIATTLIKAQRQTLLYLGAQHVEVLKLEDLSEPFMPDGWMHVTEKSGAFQDFLANRWVYPFFTGYRPTGHSLMVERGDPPPATFYKPPSNRQSNMASDASPWRNMVTLS